MTPLFFTLANKRSLMILPDTQFKMDGHPIIAYNYSIFINHFDTTLPVLGRNDIVKPEKTGNNDYLGFITFENPGKLFTYTEGERALNSSEVQEIIEYISHVRDNPGLWKNMDLS